VSKLESKWAMLARIAVIRGLAHCGFYHYWSNKKNFPLFIPVSVADSEGDRVHMMAMVTEEPPPANQFEQHVEYAKRWLIGYFDKQMLKTSSYILQGVYAEPIADNTVALVEVYSLGDAPEYLDCLIDVGINHAKLLVDKLAKAS
jgi:hypothetical protein